MNEATLTVEGGTGIYKYKITGSGVTIIEESEEDTPTQLPADWYILKPEEKEEIRNKNKAITVTEDGSGLPIGTEIFIIGEIGSFDIKYIEMSGPAEFINIILGTNYLFYGADEENAAIISGYGVTPNVWLNSEYTQYTGPCLIQLYEIMYNKNEICYCESYLTRMINSFGTPSWYDIHSQEEYNEIAGKGGLIEDNGIVIASDNLNVETRTNDYIVLFPNIYIVVNLNGIGKYAYYINEAWGEQRYQKWFQFDEYDEISSSAPSVPAPTITGNEFNTIYSQDYLDRLLEHI